MNALARFAMQQICETLNNAKYLFLTMDTSNHKSEIDTSSCQIIYAQ